MDNIVKTTKQRVETMLRKMHTKAAILCLLTALPLQAVAGGIAAPSTAGNASGLFNLKVHCAEKMEADGETTHAAGQICNCFFSQVEKAHGEAVFLQKWRKAHPHTPVKGKFGALVNTQAEACLAAEKKLQKNHKNIQKINRENAVKQQFNAMLKTETQRMLVRSLAGGIPIKAACSARVTFSQTGTITQTGVARGQTACPEWVYMRLDNAYVPTNALWEKVVKAPITVDLEITP